MIRRIQAPKKEEKARVTNEPTALMKTMWPSGRHSSAQPATGSSDTTAIAPIARRRGSSMKQCGASAKVISRVSPTRKAAGRKRASITPR